MVVLPLSAMTLLVALPEGANAQLAIASVIQAGIKRIVRAVDLKVQRLQNKTIWLQNAQKTVENQLSKFKLDEIADWTERQRKLYQDYYEELKKVKSVISTYHRVKELAGTQKAIIGEYQSMSAKFQRDGHFQPDELSKMERTYRGMLDESLKCLDQVFMVVNSFKTQMSDGKRLEMIDAIADDMQDIYADLRQFNQQNVSVSLQRSKSSLELKTLKQVYAID